MLHRAFSLIGGMGIPCSCVNQSAEVTRQRIARGDCFVALSDGVIVGTITLYAPDSASDSAHYRATQVASIRQLGVDPHLQGRGVGMALLRLAERWALRSGYTCVALDTPEAAGHLIDYYLRQGFHIQETLQFSGRPYRSVIFTKTLCNQASTTRRALFMEGSRHPVTALQSPVKGPRRRESIPCRVSASTYGCHLQCAQVINTGTDLPRRKR
jgi:GNAT superfamily N-acetyltransferase